MQERILFDNKKFNILVYRLAYEVIENYQMLDEFSIIGIQPRGVYLSRIIKKIIQELKPSMHINYGEIDATFYRDDFRRYKQPLVPQATKIDFSVENQRVLLIDDVLFTGRTIRSSIDALLSLGRPIKIELMVLVDRKRHRELPIQAHYIGIAVDTLNSETVQVNWTDSHSPDSIRIVSNSSYN